MNIAILDDSKEDLRQVKSVISSYYESQHTSADIHLYSSAEAFLLIHTRIYDLIIMDIIWQYDRYGCSQKAPRSQGYSCSDFYFKQ